MDITAIIKRVEATKTVGANQDFKIRDLIVTTDEQYPQTLCIQFVKEKCEELDKFAPGTKVKIDINLRGKETTKDGKVMV
ncbi:MAG: DUF3127 domain-containing protein, partial [Methylotenera sp.]|nr:DUF3127 domain-containing protein [Flavobacterium sp.]